jgi:hypothetical protein
VGLREGVRLRALFSGAMGFSVTGDNMLNWYQSMTHPEQARRIAELDDPNTSTERRREIADWWARHDPNVFGNWVTDGDYLQFQELSLMYRVPQSFAGRFGFSNLFVSLAGQNLRLWTNSFYIGDPGQSLTSVSQNAAVVQTYQRHNLPSPRKFTVSFRGGW